MRRETSQREEEHNDDNEDDDRATERGYSAGVEEESRDLEKNEHFRGRSRMQKERVEN